MDHRRRAWPPRHADARRALAGWLMAALAATLALPVDAAIDGPVALEVRPDILHLDRTRHDQPPGDAAPIEGHAPGLGARSLDTWWAGQGPAAVGLGVQHRWQAPDAMRPPGAGDARRPQLILSLGWRAGPRSRVVWQSEAFGGAPQAHDVPALPDLDDADAPDRAGHRLDLRRSDAYRAMLRGSMRMNLGRDASLSIKPRGRRLGVTYNRRW